MFIYLKISLGDDVNFNYKKQSFYLINQFYNDISIYPNTFVINAFLWKFYLSHLMGKENDSVI